MSAGVERPAPARKPARSADPGATAPPEERGVVSVVIPVFNQARYLADAIDSVRRQTYEHTELIVVDDGSTDESASVARGYPDVRLLQQPRSGAAPARERGLRASRGELVIFLDADDRLLPNAVEQGVRALQAHPDWAFVSGRYVFIDDAGEFVSQPERPLVERDHYLALLRGNYVGMIATVMFRRAPLLRLPTLDTGLRSCEDYVMLLALAREHPVGMHPAVVAEYRWHGENKSSDPRRMLYASLTVLKRERRLVRGDDRCRAALDAGEAYYREYYGNQLVAVLQELERQGRWRQVVPRLLALWRYHPRGFRHHITTKGAGLLRRLVPGGRSDRAAGES